MDPDEVAELIARVEERVTALLGRFERIESKQDQASVRGNAILVTLSTAIVLLLINFVIDHV